MRVNYNISLIWNKAILGKLPCNLTILPVRLQWGRYILPRTIPVVLDKQRFDGWETTLISSYALTCALKKGQLPLPSVMKNWMIKLDYDRPSDLRYPLVNSHITMERSTIFNGKKIHYKSPFSIAFCMFTRPGNYGKSAWSVEHHRSKWGGCSIAMRARHVWWHRCRKIYSWPVFLSLIAMSHHHINKIHHQITTKSPMTTLRVIPWMTITIVNLHQY